MKTTLTLLTALISLFSFGQGIFQKSTHIGGYGGASLNVYPGGNASVSGEGAWIFSNFYIGGHGFGASLGTYYSPEQEKNFEISRSGGGFMIGALSNNQNLLALFAEVRCTFGDVSAKHTLGPNTFEYYEEFAFTATPTVGITVTPVDFLQVRAFGGYQLASDVDLVGIGNEPLQGGVFGFGLYFGAFRFMD